MNYPDYSRACELGVRRLTNTKAITFAQRVKIIDACLAARSFEELEPWIQDLLRPDFEAMEEFLRQPPRPARSIPAVGRHELKPSGFANLLGGSMTRPPRETQPDPDGRFSLCSQPPPAPPTGGPPPTPPSRPTPPDTKALDPTAYETKAAPGLRIEPYDPDAIDGDGDGIVQEGTAWERPAGTRLLDAAGQPIERGLTSQIRPQGLRIVDSDGNDVAYRPRYGAGLPERTLAEPTKPTSKLGELGFPSLREQGMAPIIDMMAPPAPKPVKEPKPAPKTTTPAPAATQATAIDVPWTIGIDGVEDPEIVAERESRVGDQLDRAGWTMHDILTNPGETMLRYYHGRSFDQHSLTPEQEEDLAVLETFAAQLLAELGTGDEIEQNFEELALANLAEFIADLERGQLLINTSPEDAAKVLEDGRYFSQFVTDKSSAGNADLDYRQMIEHRFGVPKDAPDEMRPVYGHVAPEGDATPYAERFAAKMYGEITFILKPGLAERATFSIGDSYNTFFAASLADADAASGSNLLASAVDPSLLGWFYVRAYRDQLQALGADPNTLDLATLMAARRFGLLPNQTEAFDIDVLPTGDFYYVEHQLHGGMSLDDVEAIHILPNRPIPSDADAAARESIASENAEKDRLRKLAKDRGITVIDKVDASPNAEQARVGEAATASVLEALGGTPGGPLPYKPGEITKDRQVPERLGPTLEQAYVNRMARIEELVQASLDSVFPPGGSWRETYRSSLEEKLLPSVVKMKLIEILDDHRDAPILLSTDAELFLGFLSDGTYMPALGLDGELGDIGPMRRKYELEGLGVPTDLPIERRPVYGHVDTRVEGDDVRSLPGADYGQIHIVLKSEVNDRRTVTVGDSLAGQSLAVIPGETATPDLAILAIDESLLPVLVDQVAAAKVAELIEDQRRFWGADFSERQQQQLGIPELHEWIAGVSSRNTREGDISSVRFLDSVYLEAQIHDGVSVDDVAEIIVPAGDDPQLKAVRAAAKERGIRVVDESNARRVTPIADVAKSLFTGGFPRFPTAFRAENMDDSSLEQIAADGLSSQELDQFIAERNGELVFLEEKFADFVANLEETLRERAALAQTSNMTEIEKREAARLAGIVVGQDRVRARIRARMLQQERRSTQGPLLETDLERLREEYGLPELPDPSEWPPTDEHLGYPSRGLDVPNKELREDRRKTAYALTAAKRVSDLFSGDFGYEADHTYTYVDELGEEVQITFLELAQIALGDRGIDAELTTRSVQLLRDAVEDLRRGRPVINVPDDVVDGILTQGRYWSQFITGTSNGSLDAAERSESEWQFAGVDPEIADEDRPVYGHIVSSAEEIQRANSYGNWALVLRPDTTEARTTFTVDDSLGTPNIALPLTGEYTDEELMMWFYAPEGGFYGIGGAKHFMDVAMADLIREAAREMGIDARQVEESIRDLGLETRMSSGLPDPGADSQYLEAQIHGGVSLHDIESLLIPLDEWDSMTPNKRAEISRITEAMGIDVVHEISPRG